MNYIGKTLSNYVKNNEGKHIAIGFKSTAGYMFFGECSKDKLTELAETYDAMQEKRIKRFYKSELSQLRRIENDREDVLAFYMKKLSLKAAEKAIENEKNKIEWNLTECEKFFRSSKQFLSRKIVDMYDSILSPDTTCLILQGQFRDVAGYWDEDEFINGKPKYEGSDDYEDEDDF